MRLLHGVAPAALGMPAALAHQLANLGASPDHIIPGHDPLVMQLYPAPTPAMDGVVVRLDVMPKTAGQCASGAKRPATA